MYFRKRYHEVGGLKHLITLSSLVQLRAVATILGRYASPP